MEDVRVCLKCHKEFIAKSKNQKYCRHPCESFPKKNYERKNCKQCNELFSPRTMYQKFCNQKCRQEYTYNLYKNVPSPHDRIRLIIFDRDGFSCIYCGKTSYGDRSELHLDHIIPKSKGGSDYAENLVTSCIECNLAKSDHILFSIDKILLEVNKRNELAGIHPKQTIIVK